MEFNKIAFIALVQAEQERFAPPVQELRAEFSRMRHTTERPFVRDELIRSLLQGADFYQRLHALTLGHEAEAIRFLETLHEAGEITEHIRDHVTMALSIDSWAEVDE